MKCELFDHLNDVVRIDEKSTKQIMRKVLNAVHFLHKNDIIHRDIKLVCTWKKCIFYLHLGKYTDWRHFKFEVDRFWLCCPNYGNKNKGRLRYTGLHGTRSVEMWLRSKKVPSTLKCLQYNVFSPGYSKPADIWSCGVLCAQLLIGSSPFYNRREIHMLRSIMEAKYSMAGSDWDGISKSAKSFISKLLTLDQDKRLTAAEVS